MGHVFAMSFDHINQRFVTAEVPTWEIHFPGVVPAKNMALQAYCQQDSVGLFANALLSPGAGEALRLILQEKGPEPC